MLDQLKACAETYAGGLKVKLDHSGGAGDIVGAIRNFRIDGNQLRGDLHLLTSSARRAYVLELASTMPGSFGLSVSFSGPTQLGQDGQSYARCTEIYSCDLVNEPAANPGGLFSTGTEQLVRFDALLTKSFAVLGDKVGAWRKAIAEDPAGYRAFIRAGRRPSIDGRRTF